MMRFSLLLAVLAFGALAARADDITTSPETVWTWLENGWHIIPEARDDIVEWNYDHADSAWHVAFSPGVRATRVTRSDGVVLLDDSYNANPTSMRAALDALADLPARRRLAVLGVMAIWNGKGSSDYGLLYTDPRLPALGQRMMLPPHPHLRRSARANGSPIYSCSAGNASTPAA